MSTWPRIGDAAAHAALESFTAVGPIGALVLAYHTWDRQARSSTHRVAVGLLLAFVGLTLFLAGVALAFVPAGERVSAGLAERNAWLVAPVGFFLGLVATYAEPAVRVMRIQVERVSAGAIDGRLLMSAIASGVGLVVALAMARIVLDFPLWWVLLPGYVLVFALAPFTDRRFVGMAFDSGGIATGPMAVTFILSLAVGAAQQLPDRDPATLAFGMVAMIALAPILTVLTLGVVYRFAATDQPPTGSQP